MGEREPSNGWRTGQDPVQRRLRIVAVVVFGAVVVYLSVDRSRSVTDTIATIALLLAAIMILLGYERIVRLPYIGRRKGDDE